MMIVKFGERVTTWPMKPYEFSKLLTKNSMHAGIMYPKAAWQAVGGYPTKMMYGREDWAFNIALGIQGYCGHHIQRPGYLYRREHQNRSLRNQGKAWRERFLMQVRALYPEIYAGERPIMCCGRDTSVVAKLNSNGGSAKMTAFSTGLTGAEGMVLIEYTGLNFGTETWQPVPARRYELGGSRKFGYIDRRDVEWFLSRRDHRGPLFRLVPKPVEPEISPAEAEQVNPVKVAALSEAADALTVPNPADYSIGGLKELTQTADEWKLMIEKERASESPRSGAIRYMEKQLG
jgi:hypothetical protein